MVKACPSLEENFLPRKKQGPTFSWFHLCSATHHWSCDMKTSELKGFLAAVDIIRLRLKSQSLFLGLHQWAAFWVMLESSPQELHGGCQLASLRASRSNLPSRVLLPCALCCLASSKWAPCFSIKCFADIDIPVRNQQTDYKSQSSLQSLLFSDFGYEFGGFGQPNPDSCHKYPWTPKANMPINRHRQWC